MNRKRQVCHVKLAQSIAFFTYHTQFMYNVKNVAREHLEASMADNGAGLVVGETDNSTGGAAPGIEIRDPLTTSLRCSMV